MQRKEHSEDPPEHWRLSDAIPLARLFVNELQVFPINAQIDGQRGFF